jgi:hypothetical protein
MLAGNILIAIAITIVFCVLMAGVYTLWVGGDTARSWSNKLMRLRILAQLVAIVIIVIVFYFMRQH